MRPRPRRIALVGENRPSATASVHATKSGGRKPPVVRETRLQVIPPTPCDTLDLPKPRRVHVRGAGRKRAPLQLRYSHPRRADARRSFWACVCASEKSSLFRQTVVVTAPRAGGVSPPWNARMCVPQLPNTARLSRHSVHITHPRRADARRSCLSVPLPLNSACLLPHTACVRHPRRA